MNKLIMYPLFILTVIAILSFSVSLVEQSDFDETMDNPSSVGYWVKGNDYLEWYWWDNATSSLWKVHFDEKMTFNTKWNHFMIEDNNNNMHGWYSSQKDFEEDRMQISAIINPFDVEVMIGALAFAIATATAAGIAVFGSGISEFSQRLIFSSMLFGALWISLSVAASQLLTDDVLGIFAKLIYVGLTISYVVGFASDVLEA